MQGETRRHGEHGEEKAMDGPRAPGLGVENILKACPKCGCGDLFVRKDFPQRIGLAIVVLAGMTFLVLAAWPRWFYLGAWVLVAAVFADALMYLVVPKITVCYRCRAEFRDVPINPAHGGYELATGEKYRAVEK